MQKRSVVGVIVLTFVTFGLYAIYWQVKTKGEMVEQGADIPTAWLMIIPIANIYFAWKWCCGVEHVTRGRMSGPVALILMLFLSFIGMAIIQDALNKAIDEGLTNNLRAPLPQARIA